MVSHQVRVESDPSAEKHVDDNHDMNDDGEVDDDDVETDDDNDDEGDGSEESHESVESDSGEDDNEEGSNSSEVSRSASNSSVPKCWSGVMVHHIPVTAQPRRVAKRAWMQPPPGYMPAPGCPRGLEYLSMLDKLVVKQEAHLMEVILPYEVSNRYEILNPMGMKVFEAAEETDCLMRHCCGTRRPFTIHVTNNFGEDILLFKRQKKLLVVCCDCACLGRAWQDEVRVVTAVTPEQLGSLRHNCSPFYPHFTLYDEADRPVLYVKGPFCLAFAFEQCCDVHFDVLNSDKVKVGSISKHMAGILKELFTDADNFGVTFPIEMDVRQKACLLGAVFLIDFSFFETGPVSFPMTK